MIQLARFSRTSIYDLDHNIPVGDVHAIYIAYYNYSEDMSKNSGVDMEELQEEVEG